MAEPLKVSRSVTIPASELQWSFTRSSGPGGQSVNTTDSRVELRWDVARSRVLGPIQRDRLLHRLRSRIVDGVIVVSASRERSQLLNREEAARRLADLVRKGLQPPPPPRRSTTPSRGAVERRISAKKKRGTTKQQRRTPTED